MAVYRGVSTISLMAVVSALPVLPLRGTVLFPAISLPIVVGRSASLRAIEAAAQSEGRVFAVAQREDAMSPRPTNSTRSA